MIEACWTASQGSQSLNQSAMRCCEFPHTQQCRELLHTQQCCECSHTAMCGRQVTKPRCIVRAGLVGLPPTAPGHHLQMRPNARIVPLGGPRRASPALKVENGGDDLVHKWWHCCVCILPNSTRGEGDRTAPGQLKGSHQEVQSSELWEADGSTEPHRSIFHSRLHLHLGRQ